MTETNTKLAKICANCKYWEPIKNTWMADNRHNYGNFGDCSNPSFIYAEEAVFELSTFMENQPEDALVYCDKEGYFAWFSTGPNFGCIHFDKQELQND